MPASDGICIESVALWVTFKARGGWTYIATIPFVNLRQLVSLSLAVITVIGAGLDGYLSGVWPPEYIYEGALIALSAWMGLDLWQYSIKRKTTDPAIPSAQNIMAAQQASGGVVDARVAREARDAIRGQTGEMPVPPTPTDIPPRPDLGVPDRGVL